MFLNAHSFLELRSQKTVRLSELIVHGQICEHISAPNGSFFVYAMMAKPMKTLELHYPMMQFLIILNTISKSLL